MLGTMSIQEVGESMSTQTDVSQLTMVDDAILSAIDNGLTRCIISEELCDFVLYYLESMGYIVTFAPELGGFEVAWPTENLSELGIDFTCTD